MDGGRFDAWARTLVAGRSRRGALRLLAGGTLGVLLRQWTPAGVIAGRIVCNRAGRGCTAARPCCSGARCRGGTCVCLRGLTNCDGLCRNLRNSERHCGTCFQPCAAGQTCCAGSCVDPATFQSDPNNCGACRRVCPNEPTINGHTCVDGECCRPLGARCDGCSEGVCTGHGCCSPYCIDGFCACGPSGTICAGSAVFCCSGRCEGGNCA